MVIMHSSLRRWRRISPLVAPYTGHVRYRLRDGRKLELEWNCAQVQYGSCVYLAPIVIKVKLSGHECGGVLVRYHRNGLT